MESTIVDVGRLWSPPARWGRPPASWIAAKKTQAVVSHPQAPTAAAVLWTTVSWALAAGAAHVASRWKRTA
ncbi:MAG: hypothetical protein U0529_03510 [Thermoanaerobaculia bacterium]